MAGLFSNVVDWMRSPERTQQMQGLGNYLGFEVTNLKLGPAGVLIKKKQTPTDIFSNSLAPTIE